MNPSQSLHKRPKILVVEDEATTAQHLCQSLMRLGYDVVGIAASGTAALGLAEKDLPDLFLADIGLQGDLDGIEVAARARDNWAIPTVFLTAYADKEMISRAGTVASYGYLVKPFSEPELQATIEIALQQRSLEEQWKQLSEKNARVLQRTREELRAMTVKLYSAREDERQRIARDLHDDVVQRLAVVQIEIEGVQRRLANLHDKKVDDQFRTILKHVTELIVDLRDVCHRLHPSVLDDLGLPVALRQLAEEFEEKYSIPSRVSLRNLPKIVPAELAITLYRIAQEALQNIAKHAGDATVSIALIGGRDSLNLSIRDTGKGFDATAPKNRIGLGLTSMAQRAELYGGTFALQSEPGEGTQIHVRMPLRVDSDVPRAVSAVAVGSELKRR